ncbi:MAG: Nif3-like dinuclear metal center hexameric protein [Firmicutes bacterium]|nr:Nif3-like dinuclear metal center hexameric protein [Bacillota bacterium]
MNYQDLIDIIEEIAPTEWFEEEDNSGIQIHTGKEEIDRVLVCLEVNDAVLQEAQDKGADMIITHHPLLFHPLQRITPDTPVGRYALHAIEQGIDIYSSHLAFDAAVHGNNMYLADLLRLQNVARPEDEDEDEDEEYDFAGIEFDGDDEDDAYEYDPDEVGSIGFLPRTLNFREFQTYVERCLNLPQNYVRCVDGGRDEICKVAFCTGAGGDYIYTAVREGCDAYITGDLKLHEAQYAKAMGLTVIDAGHYGTEKIFTENMAAQLRAKAGDALEVIEAESNTNPYTL